MGQGFLARVHRQRLVYNSIVNRKCFEHEISATKNKYLHWFATCQAANRFLDGRSR